MNWNVCKGLLNRCIFQNKASEGHETKAAFQGSFKLRQALALDDVAVERYRQSY